MNNGKEILFKAVSGPFASTAWIKGDEEYNDILGRKFEAITADDNQAYSLERYKIRRLKNMDEFVKLSNDSCEEFKNVIKADLF